MIFICCSTKGHSCRSSEDRLIFESNNAFAGSFLFDFEHAHGGVQRLDVMIGTLSLLLLGFFLILGRSFSLYELSLLGDDMFSSGGGGSVFLFLFFLLAFFLLLHVVDEEKIEQ